MQTFRPRPDPLNGETLLGELAGVGVHVDGFPEVRDDALLLGVAEGDRATVEAVLAAHEGAVSPRTVDRQAIRTAARDHLATLRSIRDSDGDLNQRQLSNAVRALARGQVRVIRLLLNEFDGTD